MSGSVKPDWYCPKHQDRHQQPMVLSIDEAEIGRYCFYCYNEWLEKCLGQMRERTGCRNCGNERTDLECSKCGRPFCSHNCAECHSDCIAPNGQVSWSHSIVENHPSHCGREWDTEREDGPSE